MHFLGAACPCNNNSLRSFKWIVHIPPPKANRKQHQASQLLCYLHAALALGQTLLLVWSTICRRDGAKQLYLLGGMSSYVPWISCEKNGCFFVGLQIHMFLTRHTVVGSEIRWTTLLFRKPMKFMGIFLPISTGGFLNHENSPFRFRWEWKKTYERWRPEILLCFFDILVMI